MHWMFVSCALIAVLGAAALAHPHPHPADHDHAAHHDHSGGMDCEKLSGPNADFGFALYKRLSTAAAGKNVFFSPLGISAALSMLSAGAAVETHSQLSSVLGYSSHTQAQINEAYKHLFHMLGHSQQNQQLEMGNAAAVRSGFNPLETFLKDIKDYYHGEVMSIDFAKTAEAVAEINRFIAGKTHDKITDMVKDLDADTAMVLINYVFFRGQWEKPFDRNLTRKADFHVDENTKVAVDMMKRMGRFDFYQDYEKHATILQLPYKGNTSMLIVLPDEGKMSEVEGIISKEHLRQWHDSLSRSSVDVFLPKFSISAEASLSSTLKEMGITNAFDDNANFSGISSEIKLKVSKVNHKAVLSVDEVGTEAAAVTTIEVMPMSMPEIVNLNRPFMVFILEHSTKSILFMGKINNPTM